MYQTCDIIFISAAITELGAFRELMSSGMHKLNYNIIKLIDIF